MRESAFQKQVIQLARLRGWRVCHFGNTLKFVAKKGGGHETRPDPMGKGFPDLVLVRKGRLIFAELKSETGKVSVEQSMWLRDLTPCKCETYLWRPENLDEINEILK